MYAPYHLGTFGVEGSGFVQNKAILQVGLVCLIVDVLVVHVIDLRSVVGTVPLPSDPFADGLCSWDDGKTRLFEVEFVVHAPTEHSKDEKHKDDKEEDGHGGHVLVSCGIE